MYQNDNNKHKRLQIRRSGQAPFMTKDLSKCIMTRSKVRNICLKRPSWESFLAQKKAKGVGNVLLRKAKNNIFKNFSPKRTIPNKHFLAYSQREREREREREKRKEKSNKP